VLDIVGPSSTFLRLTSPGGVIGESREFGSVETVVRYGNFKALLTGDSQAVEIEDALAGVSNPGIDVLQVPHHGSKSGLSEEAVRALRPALAVISVGKNKYGHPSKQTVGLLDSLNITYLRTDRVGDVEIVSDGRNWSVK